MNKITTLIPMTEFVLSLPPDYNYKEIARLSVYYAQFLKQPLQEWMFEGEDRLFELYRDPNWIKSMIIDGEKIELLTNIADKAFLTPKAIEQIYGSI